MYPITPEPIGGPARVPHVFFYCRLIAILVLIEYGALAQSVKCSVTYGKETSPAQQAFLHGDFEHAASLYQEQLQHNPNDTAATVGLVHVLLRQQKVKEADELIQKAIAGQPKSVPLLVAQAEVQYREGKPWEAETTANTATRLDLCSAQLHLLRARILRLASHYKSAAAEIRTAHQLEPDDPSIRLRWLETLPGAERISELEAYLASPTGNDPEEIKHLHFYLDYLKKQHDQPRKACRLVSDTSSTSIPFALMMRDGTHIRAFGLDVKLNDHNARLEIDTGASGLVISRSVANRAGLQQFSKLEAHGVGDKGSQAAYTAFADSIKIGSLEFRDCDVEVLDQRNVVDSDGLIGMDVFSRFLVTLDYPMRKLLLGPLPPRPDDVAPEKPTLETAASPEEETGDRPDPASSGATQKTARPRGPRDRYIAPEMKTWTPVYRVGHNLLLPASLNNSSIKLFILDTGAFTTTISPAVAREVTKVRAEDYITVKGISGKVDKVYTADEITFRFANLSQKVRDVVAFDTPGISKSIGMDVSGFIGFTALGQTTMKIDYRDGLVSFSYDANRGYRF
jgi:predicted aspartyl protease/Flp pilus assembly protein TadD